MSKLLIAFLALSVIGVAVADADPLSDAKEQIATSSYIEAQASLEAAYASGQNSPEQLAEVWRLRGIVAGALEDAASAADAFGRCLALTPAVELPPGTSPKIERPFRAAQNSARAASPLAIRKVTTEAPPTIAVVVDSDPMQMITRVRFRVKVDAGPTTSLEQPLAGRTRLVLPLPRGERFDIQVAALDEKGNRLAELGTLEVPIVIVAKPAPAASKRPPHPAAPAPSRSRPLYARWWLWGGASVVVAATSAYWGLAGLAAADDLKALQANSVRYSFDEARSVEARARRDLLISNVGFGIAGALAVTAAVFAFTSTRPERKGLAIEPLHDGATLAFGGQF